MISEFSSIFDIRRGKKPHWPTFRGGNYTTNVREGLRHMEKLMYFAAGSHWVHLLDNGGFGRHGHPDSIPCEVCSWEKEVYCQRVDINRKTKLYLLAWLGFYPPGKTGGKGGSILHIGWQFPHVNKFQHTSLEQVALDHYVDVARVVYNNREVDREVYQFITANGREFNG